MARKILKAKDIEALENTTTLPLGVVVAVQEAAVTLPQNDSSTYSCPTLSTCTTFTGFCRLPTLDCTTFTAASCS